MIGTEDKKTQEITYNLIENGIQIKYNFLNETQILALQAECEKLFSKTQLYGLAYSVRLNKYVSEVPYPTVQINSVNILEVAIDIAKEIEKLGYKNYKLGHVALYNEFNNPRELVWHSDMRNGGLIRAQIVIRGGGQNSGAFRYYKGSHKVASSDVPYPEAGYLENNKQDLITCDKKNGSLFLINTLGYHSKCVCQETRTSFMFDFLPEEYISLTPNDCSSDVRLSSSKLSQKVLDNISLFQSGVSPDTRSENTPDAYKFNKDLAGANLSDLSGFVKYFATKVIKGGLKRLGVKA